MDRAEKKEMVETLNDIFTTSGSVVVARYKGLTVAQMTELRRRMGGAGAQFKVIKNRLAKIALANTADGAGADLFLEPTGIAYAKDPVTAAKVAADFAKTTDKFVIVGGLLGKQALDADSVKALAAIPSMEELRSKLLSVFLAPGTNLVRQLNAPAQNLVGVLAAYKEKQEKQEAA
ncbi:50S ribosomal protein L10 [Rhodomicrobium vannielii ATCC 17100]|uniref:Large ribosomal subunit protein uL10 n=1 Tax=Rhodomicrobium udaipurense TaxID=1202716 RepID=A0A8I1G7I4_9HYPH|nr:50S ribosomal protein L10 [Rhodomicrobium udaipurense]KAI94456.1 50S ribosomal protein L10 [Rhodomicrobium udaipurense JA643]MBJ7535886.1 50S ribosomal protein L10 [Rhodomicrobium vannielii ATCC 17100]MBJ7542027.1 50S ribosomal protein L10 [Rhodomicrobium udaipurense]